jgi:hypothetical protein
MPGLPLEPFQRLLIQGDQKMKKAVIFAVASCLLFSSVAFAFEGSKSTSDKGSYTEQMAKKKTKKTKKAAPAN